MPDRRALNERTTSSEKRHYEPIDTAAPFRLAPLATHPLNGGGQVKWRRGSPFKNGARRAPPPPSEPSRRRRYYKTHRPLKGKRLTTFCASPALLQNVFAVHRRAIPQPSARRAVKLKNPPANGRSILRTFLYNPSTQPAAEPRPFSLKSAPEGRHHHPRPKGPSNLRTLRIFGTKSRQPSHRRCVPQGRMYDKIKCSK